jgi:hypothetical protein
MLKSITKAQKKIKHEKKKYLNFVLTRRKRLRCAFRFSCFRGHA